MHLTFHEVVPENGNTYLARFLQLCTGVTNGRMGGLQISSGEELWRVDGGATGSQQTTAARA